MPLNSEDTKIYRQDVATKGKVLSTKGRAELINPYLPPPEEVNGIENARKKIQKQPSNGHRRRIRPFFKSQIHFFIYFLIQLIYGVFIRFQTFYFAICDRVIALIHFHNRSPELIRKDVLKLERLPEHLSVILLYKQDDDGGFETLADEVAELCAWSSAAGIPVLSIYEETGILKMYKKSVETLINVKLMAYFGSPPATPILRVHVPNQTSTIPSPASPSIVNGHHNGTDGPSQPARPQIDLLFLSKTDGRDTLVDLTRTLTEMAQANKIKPKDITSKLINDEIMHTTTVHGQVPGTPQVDHEPGEPDLVMIFGPKTKLYGFPPWQIRLSEIFCVGGEVRNGSTRVEYQGFLRGLWRYAGAEMRFGR